MTMIQWFIFFLAIQIIHYICTWKLYQKAGRKSWEAAVPVYNAIVLMKIINRPWWWVILLFIPVINLIMFPVVWVETIRSFGKNTIADTWLAILTLGLYVGYVNYNADNLAYIQDRSLKPKTEVGEWVSSILFAIVAATIVHNYIMQPFVIPTSSLEKTLLVGDFLFVSKFHYGARTPMTPVAAPMVHDTIPILGIKSYSKWPQLPYFRFPGFEEVKKNDIVVFNWPVDTVPYFHYMGREKYFKPVDKRSNYVKRCVATPGDTLQIKDGYVYIDGKRLQLPERAKPQYSYNVEVTQGLSANYFYKNYGVTDQFYPGKVGYIFTSLTDEAVAKMKNDPSIVKVTKLLNKDGVREASTFPQSNNFNWNKDFYGPIYIPKKGATVTLTSQNIPLYKRLIKVYEGNDDAVVKNGQLFIHNQPVKTYTFKQNYYWMMGDNRDNSEDSRYWGYVPEDHIVGKPVFIWFSWDTHAKGIMNKVRWNRLFTTVGGNGEPTSYLPYFLVAIALYAGFSIFRNKKKKA
ncbi:signal peptidase I [Zhouia sp. PK063]|uniref:signal peptidase I n=1 Tax=Zhouia sp. PK063 TaxID=3373602 RepID=UPI003788896F